MSSASSLPSLSVADVYDMAADIGKEFERLIDSHGPDHVSDLMQKVILVLEHLERYAAENQADNETIETLTNTVKHLELEEVKKAEERQRNAQELEQIEEHYKQETRDLLSTVKRLQDENRKLASSLAAANERDSAFSEDEAYFEVDLVNRLQSVIEKQRGQIKKLDQSVLDLKIENDELKCHNDKLTSCTRDLRRKFRSTQLQLHELVDERAELTAKLHDSHRDVQTLTKHLGHVEKDTKDTADQKENDPKRPRFTLSELKEILQERNALKAKVSDLEDELAVYRPRTNPSSDLSSRRVRLSAGPTNCDCSYHSQRGDIESEEEAREAQEIEDEHDRKSESCPHDEDLPVQGPLPEDPEDAPWRKHQESGIRKLFRRVFGSPSHGLPTSQSTPALNNAVETSEKAKIKKSLSRFSFLVGGQRTEEQDEDDIEED